MLHFSSYSDQFHEYMKIESKHEKNTSIITRIPENFNYSTKYENLLN